MVTRDIKHDGFTFRHTEPYGWEVYWNGWVSLHAGDSDEELKTMWPEEKAAIIQQRLGL